MSVQDTTAHQEVRQSRRSAGLAMVLALLFGGVALFYVLPWRKALLPAILSYVLVAASGGTLWVPVFLGIGLWAVRYAKFTEGPLGFHGAEVDIQQGMPAPHNSDSTPPSAYIRVQNRD